MVDPVLSFVKAFGLRGDKDSLKKLVCERFSSELVACDKRPLWEVCGSAFEAASLPFQVHRDFDRHSQLSADLDDILTAFDALDITDPVPAIFSEASDLHILPPLSSDPVGEQVLANTQALNSLSSLVNSLKEKLSALLSASIASNGASNVSQSYACVASSLPPTTSSITLPNSQGKHRDDFRDSNVIIFGLPERKSIVETKADVDEVFEFLAGKPIEIKDLFCLGKFSQSSHPHPLLVKLSSIWDRK